MKCPHCGAVNPDGSKFCSACGQPCASEPQPAPMEINATEAADAYNPYANAEVPQEAYPQEAYPQEAYPQEAYPQEAYPPEPYPQGTYPQPWQAPPARQLATNRSLPKFFFLSLITFGIYGIVVMSNVSVSINTAASRYDGQKTMHYCLVCFLFSWLTLGIVPLVWYSKLSARVGRELRRRGIRHNFGAKDFWLWGVLGVFIIAGPFIYCHKLFKGMNLICEDYNRVG